MKGELSGVGPRLGRGSGIPAKAVMPEKIFAGRPVWPAFPAQAGNHIFSQVVTPLKKSTTPLEIAYTQFQ